MLHYKLRTLLILLAVGPPMLAVGWYGIEKYRDSLRRDIWEDVGGPGMIDSFGGGIGLFVGEDGNVYCKMIGDEDQTEPESTSP